MFRLLILASTLVTQAAAIRPFAIEVVDDRTGRGVPLVELRTVHNVRLITDSVGVAAFYEPGLMGERVFFHVSSHGYEFPKDGFGYRGKALEVVEEGRARLEIRRVNVAERLYRVTGGGVYRDSLVVGRTPPIRQPAINARVLGSDSVVNAVLGGRLHWFWGDTNRPGYPLGNFHVPGAVSDLPGRGGLDPEVGVDLTYFTDPKSGFAAETARLPGDGPTWIFGLAATPDRDGRERLSAHYTKIRPPLTAYERGLAEFDPEAGRFAKITVFPLDGPIQPSGHTLSYVDGGKSYILYATPFPFVRVPAEAEALRDPSRYEAFTPLKPGATKAEADSLDRDDRGAIRFGWKANTAPVSPGDEAKLVKAGALQPEEALTRLIDVETGKPVLAHGGSVSWNAYRSRYVMIAVESFGGPSLLGEVWYAEADTPLGPWAFARKVASHDRYSFYNPRHHPYFDKDGGRTIFFEGTYTHTFSGNPDQTPYYDYNQIMYKLDLDDDRVRLPVAIYETPEGLKARAPGHPIAFFTLDRPMGAASVPVFALRDQAGRSRLSLRADGGDPPLFHALPADAPDPPATMAPLFEYTHDDGRVAYRAGDRPAPEGFRRADRPLGRVWVHPISVVLPAD